MSDEPSSGEQRPMLQVVHGGEPSAEEIAALVVALHTTSGAPAPTRRPRSGWADRRAFVRQPLDHGPGRWVASARRPR